jgi:hypothetical protein
MPNRTRVLLFALAVSLSTAVVLADSKIEYKATEGGGASLNTMLIGQGKVRADAGQNTSVIIDPTAGSMTMLDHGKKTFTRIGRPELQQLTEMLKQVEDMMANLPPEVRQMAQSRMGGAGGAAMVVTEDTGEKSTAAGRPCRIFRTTVQGRPTAESCMGDASAIDLPAADRATMVAAMGWGKELSDALAKAPMVRIADVSPFRAGLVTLRSTIIAADGTRRTSEFVGVTSGALAADLFAVPADYKEQKLEIPRIGRGGR